MKHKIELLLDKVIEDCNTALANNETGVVEQLAAAICHLTHAVTRFAESDAELEKPEWEI